MFRQKLYEFSLVCSLVEETKKEGFVDVTQAYSKIINSIREAEDAAKMADKAASDATKVPETLCAQMKGVTTSFTL